MSGTKILFSEFLGNLSLSRLDDESAERFVLMTGLWNDINCNEQTRDQTRIKKLLKNNILMGRRYKN